MQLGLAIAVALLIIAVVAWPLLARRRNPPPLTDLSETPSSDQATALNAVYDAIRTLQTDHSLGRINDDDYRDQLDEYRRRAAELLREMDRQGGASQDG